MKDEPEGCRAGLGPTTQPVSPLVLADADVLGASLQVESEQRSRDGGQ
jgi:hypothetical protein